VGGALKSASMHRLLDRTNPNIIFLQETLVDEKKARYFMNSLRPAWLSCVVSLVRKYGGLLVTWDPNKFDLGPYLSCGGNFMTGFCFECKREIYLLNVYAPCSDRRGFWEKLVKRVMLSHKKLIAIGDFNLTVTAGEVWGDSAHVDPLVDFFKDLFQGNRLVDI